MIEKSDLLLKGGRIVDPGQKIDDVIDIAFANGKVSKIGPKHDATQSKEIVDITGYIVVPGLIDLHTHVYWGGTASSIRADLLWPKSGVTTFVDTGSAGAGNFHGLKEYVISKAKNRILALLNICFIGIPGTAVVSGKEFIVAFQDPRLFNPQAALQVAQDNRDEIVGMKVRAGHGSDGPSLQPVYMARMVSEWIDKPMMVHNGYPPPVLSEILSVMRPGDIFTHSFRAFPNCIVNNLSKILPEVLEARERGVIFDIGHGAGGFSFQTARFALEQGFFPDVISTDVHTRNINGPVYDLPTTLSKFLSLGMPLSAVIAAATINPAQAIGWDSLIGTLKEGYLADASVFDLVNEQFPLVDSMGEKIIGQKKLKHVGTVIGGAYYPHEE